MSVKVMIPTPLRVHAGKKDAVGEKGFELFKLLDETRQFIRANPVSSQVKERRRQFWSKTNGNGGSDKAAR